MEISITDDSLIKDLNKQSTNRDILEIDIAYLNTTIDDKEYERPINSRTCILASQNTCP